MEELLQRFEALPTYIKDWPGAKIRDFREKKITADKEPAKSVLDTFNKKLTQCEKKVAEAEPWLAKLIEKKHYVESILNDPLYSEDTASKDLLRTLKAIQKRLAAYEWDGDTLLKGRPFEADVKPINTDHLKEAWEKIKPQPKMVARKDVSALIDRGNECIKQFRPVFQKQGLGEKLEEWNALVDQLQQTEPDQQVDVLPLESIYREFEKHIPKAKPKKDWKKVRESYIERAKYADAATKKMGSPYHILDDEFQEAYESKNEAKLDKIYKKIDKILPKEGTYTKSVLSTAHVSEHEVLGTSYSSDEAIVDDDDEEALNSAFSDDEEEEEEEEEDSSHSERVAVPRKRGRDLLGEVLETFAPANEQIQSLYDIYVKDDHDAFASQLKKIKQISVDRWKVEIWGAGTNLRIPSVPGEVYFLSEKEANEAGDNYVRMFARCGDYEKRIIHLPAGTVENKNEDV